MKSFLAKIDSKDIEFQVEKIDDRSIVSQFGENSYKYDVVKTGFSQYSVIYKGKSYSLEFFSKNNSWQAFLDGQEIHFELFNEKDLRRKQTGGGVACASGQIISPMPGKIVDIKVNIGQKVSVGDPVITVEAMKMQNEFKSQINGLVKKINVSNGDSVDGGMVLVEVE